MNQQRAACFVGVTLALALAAIAQGEGKGLFADDIKEQKTGDIRLLDYWHAKFEYLKLQEAVKTRQPEGTIAVSLGSFGRDVDELIKKAPMHDELKKWKEWG